MSYVRLVALAQRDATLVARRKKAIEDAAARVRWLDLYAFILRHIEHARAKKNQGHSALKFECPFATLV